MTQALRPWGVVRHRGAVASPRAQGTLKHPDGETWSRDPGPTAQGEGYPQADGEHCIRPWNIISGTLSVWRRCRKRAPSS